MPFCIECGKELPDEALFCPFCGQEVNAISSAPTSGVGSADDCAEGGVAAYDIVLKYSQLLERAAQEYAFVGNAQEVELQRIGALEKEQSQKAVAEVVRTVGEERGSYVARIEEAAMALGNEAWQLFESIRVADPLYEDKIKQSLAKQMGPIEAAGNLIMEKLEMPIRFRITTNAQEIEIYPGESTDLLEKLKRGLAGLRGITPGYIERARTAQQSLGGLSNRDCFDAYYAQLIAFGYVIDCFMMMFGAVGTMFLDSSNEIKDILRSKGLSCEKASWERWKRSRIEEQTTAESRKVEQTASRMRADAAREFTRRKEKLTDDMAAQAKPAFADDVNALFQSEEGAATLESLSTGPSYCETRLFEAAVSAEVVIPCEGDRERLASRMRSWVSLPVRPDGSLGPFWAKTSITGQSFHIVFDSAQWCQAQQFLCSVILGYLTAMPLGSIRFDVLWAEPEPTNGNGVLDWLERYVPSVVGGEICRDDMTISARLASLAGRTTAGSVSGSFRFVVADGAALSRFRSEIETLIGRSGHAPHLIVFERVSTSNRMALAVGEETLPSLLQSEGAHRPVRIVVTEEGAHDASSQSVALNAPCLPQEEAVQRYLTTYRGLLDGLRGESSSYPLWLLGYMGFLGEGQREKAEDELRQHYRDLEAIRNMEGRPCESFSGQLTVGMMDCDTRLIRSKRFEGDALAIPFSFDLRRGLSLSLEGSVRTARNFANAVIGGFLTQVDAEFCRVCLIDPCDMGQSASVFGPAWKEGALPEVFDRGVCTDEEEVRACLEMVDGIVKEYLGNHFSGEIALDSHLDSSRKSEKIRLVVAFDFPRGFDERSLKCLANIIRHGAQCGVFVVLVRAEETQVPGYSRNGELLDEIFDECLAATAYENCIQIEGCAGPVRGAALPELSAVEAFVRVRKEQIREAADRKAAEEEANRSNSFEKAVPAVLFEESATNGLRIPFGINEDGALEEVLFGGSDEAQYHALVVGNSGSGKSTLLHTLILSAVLRYSPDQLNLYLMDFKSGTEFKVYENNPVPHIKLLALDSMQEFGESILEEIDSERIRRSSLFKDAGVENLDQYNNQAIEPLPRILVIIDEFQELYDEDKNRRVAENSANLTGTIIAQGRSYGIHLVLATQSYRNVRKIPSSASIKNAQIRFGLQCVEGDAYDVFGAENTRRAEEYMREGPKGHCAFTEDYSKPGCKGAQVLYCSKGEREGLLNRAASELTDFVTEMRVFEKGRRKGLLEAWESTGGLPEGSPRLTLGEPIRVSPPLTIGLSNSSYPNTLICCPNQEGSSSLADDLVKNIVLSALALGDCRVLMASGEYEVRRERWIAWCENLERRFSNRFKASWTDAGAIELVRSAFECYRENKAVGTDSNKLVLIVNGLQDLESIQSILRGDEDMDEWIGDVEDAVPGSVGAGALNSFDSLFSRYGSGLTSAGPSATEFRKQFLGLIAKGRKHGVYVVVVADSYKDLKECIRMGSYTMDSFRKRIVAGISDDDTRELLGQAGFKIKDEGVMAYADVKLGGAPILFKPYIPPDAEELEAYLAQMQFR